MASIPSCPFAIIGLSLSFPFPDRFSTSVGPWRQGARAEEAAHLSRPVGVSGFCLICLSIFASRSDSYYQSNDESRTNQTSIGESAVRMDAVCCAIHVRYRGGTGACVGFASRAAATQIGPILFHGDAGKRHSDHVVTRPRQLSTNRKHWRPPEMFGLIGARGLCYLQVSVQDVNLALLRCTI